MNDADEQRKERESVVKGRNLNRVGKGSGCSVVAVGLREFWPFAYLWYLLNLVDQIARVVLVALQVDGLCGFCMTILSVRSWV